MVGDVAWAEPEATQSPVIPHEQTQTRTPIGVFMRFCVCSPRSGGARSGYVGRSGAGLHHPLRVALPRSSRAGVAFG